MREISTTILENMLSADFNANDFFDYSTAAQVTITSADLYWVSDIVEKYDSSGLDACLAWIQNHEPLDKYKTEEFNQAISELSSKKQKVIGDIDWQMYGYNNEGPYRKISEINELRNIR